MNLLALAQNVFTIIVWSYAGVLLLTLLGMARVFQKAGRRWWEVLVPIWNFLTLLEISNTSLWWFFGLILSALAAIFGLNSGRQEVFIGAIAFQLLAMLAIGMNVARAFNRSWLFGMGLAFLPFIFYPLLGFGPWEYRGAGGTSSPFFNMFRIPELRNKVLFTLFLLAIYRIGFHVPIPGVDQEHFAKLQQTQSNQSAAGRLADYVSIFSGGSLSQSTIFGLGVMPYISASIIFQLLGTVVPSLEKLQKEGETGRKKIQEWTRYATVPLCVIQAAFWLSYMHSTRPPLVQSQFAGTISFWFMGITCLTAGTVFLMWLGEQIDEYGLGNGISLLILAGIVARMPQAMVLLGSKMNLTANPDATKPYGIGHIIFLILSFIFVVAGSILITQAQRRIPIQQAKHTRGRRVYGGQRQALPLRVNHGGVMPIIFAQSLMLFPGMFFGWLDGAVNSEGVKGFFGQLVSFFNIQFGRGSFIYILTEIVLIYFFAYFWTTVQFQPKEMANQLRDYGSFIPGLRPGKRTADYLEKVMMRMTYVGAAFLCLIAVIPTAVTAWMGIDFQIAAFLGGTGLLIVVSVALDMVQRIEANLLMRSYGGFLATPGHKGKRIKGRQY